MFSQKVCVLLVEKPAIAIHPIGYQFLAADDLLQQAAEIIEHKSWKYFNIIMRQGTATDRNRELGFSANSFDDPWLTPGTWIEKDFPPSTEISLFITSWLIELAQSAKTWPSTADKNAGK